jgi:hypothetical protein
MLDPMVVDGRRLAAILQWRCSASGGFVTSEAVLEIGADLHRVIVVGRW